MKPYDINRLFDYLCDEVFFSCFLKEFKRNIDIDYDIKFLALSNVRNIINLNLNILQVLKRVFDEKDVLMLAFKREFIDDLLSRYEYGKKIDDNDNVKNDRLKTIERIIRKYLELFDDKKEKNYLDLKKILIVFFYENGVDLFKKEGLVKLKEEEKLPEKEIEEKKEEKEEEKKEEENDKMEIDDEPIVIENKSKSHNEVIEITDDETKPEVKKGRKGKKKKNIKNKEEEEKELKEEIIEVDEDEGEDKKEEEIEKTPKRGGKKKKIEEKKVEKSPKKEIIVEEPKKKGKKPKAKKGIKTRGANIKKVEASKEETTPKKESTPSKSPNKAKEGIKTRTNSSSKKSASKSPRTTRLLSSLKKPKEEILTNLKTIKVGTSSPTQNLKMKPKSIIKKTQNFDSPSSSLRSSSSKRGSSGKKNKHFFEELEEKYNLQKKKSPSKFNVTPMKRRNSTTKTPVKEKSPSVKKITTPSSKKKSPAKLLGKKRGISFSTDRYVKEFDPKTPVKEIKTRTVRKSPLERKSSGKKKQIYLLLKYDDCYLKKKHFIFLFTNSNLKIHLSRFFDTKIAKNSIITICYLYFFM